MQVSEYIMQISEDILLLGAAGLILLILTILYLVTRSRLGKKTDELSDLQNKYSIHKKETDHLRQYKIIDDAKTEASKIVLEANSIMDDAESNYKVVLKKANLESEKIVSEANKVLNNAKHEYLRKIEEAERLTNEEMKTVKSKANKVISSANQFFSRKIEEAERLINEEMKTVKSKAKEIREKAEQKLTEAREYSNYIEKLANEKGEEIFGAAWEAKKNADQYESTATAMKNIIKGYGDEYLIPNESVLDELAGEYDHKEAGQELKKIRFQIKSMIKNGESADCDYVEENRKTIAIDFVLDAFNGKVDTILSKVKHDNYGKLLQQLVDSFRIVNHNGKPFRNARIKKLYYKAMVKQLKMAVAVKELKRLDTEEQRRIKSEIREEERARREFEKALKETEKEEKLIQKLMKEAEARLANAAAEEKFKFEQQLLELRKKLTEAEDRGQRALSMAQQTKQGHVYIISNVGSFGDEVFKIGLTRRLEPLDRVKELGDASVPFSFDIHAMIHSYDAPKLEKELHKVFTSNQVNKVNSRKEFFRVPLVDIKDKIIKLGLNTHWTMKAEALEYRESLQLTKHEFENKDPVNNSV